MTSPGPDLDALIALNQEIASMVRAGIPLELGLQQAAGSRSVRFAVLADRIAERMSQGDSLVEALRKEGPIISPAYAAVVESGLAAGRLPEALEELARIGLIAQEIRRRIWLAITYPAIVCALAYALFVAFISFVAPIWIETHEVMALPPNSFFRLLAVLHGTVGWWSPLIPLGILIVFVGPGVLSAAGLWLEDDGVWQVPGVRWIFRHLRRAQFARLLALLIDREIPAPRAVLLAAESTGDRCLNYSAVAISERLVVGATWANAVGSAKGLPAFLRWMMVTGEREGALSAVLRQAAETYQRRAERGLEWVRATLPVALVVGVCGLVVLTYGLGLFLPLQQFWLDLTRGYP